VLTISDRKCNFKVFANLNYFSQRGVYFFPKVFNYFFNMGICYVTYEREYHIQANLIVNNPRLGCNTRSTRVQNYIL